MNNYFVRRILQIIPVLFIISFIVFTLVFVAGDPVSLMLPDDAPPEAREELRETMGLNEPFFVQYITYVGYMIQGDFGDSYRLNQPALEVVIDWLPATLELGIIRIIISTIVAIPLVIWSATKQNTSLDLIATGAAVIGKAMPNFWLGIMLILLFSVTLGVFPVSGRGTIMHVILPAITLATGIADRKSTRLNSSHVSISYAV